MFSIDLMLEFSNFKAWISVFWALIIILHDYSYFFSSIMLRYISWFLLEVIFAALAQFL
jgi:hypothetical protein